MHNMLRGSMITTLRGAMLAAALSALAVSALADGNPAEGAKLFNRCKACHSLQAGQNRVGPSLAGVIGRAAGGVDGFRYSDAMASGGIVWDEATLDGYLADPRGFLPGNKMTFPGLRDGDDREDLIAYLMQATR